MKAENTLNNKAKFFAQYWGQEVLRINPYKYPYEVHCGYMHDKGMHLTPHLELTSLSSISDEDASKIEYAIHTTLGNDDRALGFKNGGNIEQCKPWVIDYLRSKGYALPWMRLSVEDQIEYGWVKLKTN